MSILKKARALGIKSSKCPYLLTLFCSGARGNIINGVKQKIILVKKTMQMVTTV
jgi:hypothetical protein